MPTKRDELCNNIHNELNDLITLCNGKMTKIIIPMLTETKGDAVSTANYLRGVGYKVTMQEEIRDHFYELHIDWQ